MTKFLEDTVVDDEIELANTKHNFFSQHVWNDTMLRVIDKKSDKKKMKLWQLEKLQIIYFDLKGSSLTK